MLIHPRVALASGLAAAAGAALLLLGRIDGSLLVAIVLAVTARAAALAGSAEPRAARALPVLARTMPAWIALGVAVTLRGGSPLLADVWGANAVLGLGLTSGDAATVLGMWLATAGVVAAIAAPTAGAGPVPLIAGDPWRRLEALALLAQIALLAGLVAGPQVTDIGDLLPWFLASAAAAGGVALTGTFAARPEPTARAALLLAVAGLAAVIVGSGP